MKGRTRGRAAWSGRGCGFPASPLHQQRFYPGNQLGQAFLYGCPNYRGIHTQVVVDQLVAHARHLAPWDFGVARAVFGGHAFGRFTNHLKGANDRVKPQFVALQCFRAFEFAQEPPCLFGVLVDVLEVSAYGFAAVQGSHLHEVAFHSRSKQRLDRAGRDDLHPNPQVVRELLLEPHQVEEGGNLLELDQEVEVASCMRVAAGARPEEEEPPHAVARAKFGEPLSKLLAVVHLCGHVFIMPEPLPRRARPVPHGLWAACAARRGSARFRTVR